MENLLRYLMFLKALSNLFRDVVDSRSTFSLAFALAIPPKVRRARYLS